MFPLVMNASYSSHFLKQFRKSSFHELCCHSCHDILNKFKVYLSCSFCVGEESKFAQCQICSARQMRTHHSALRSQPFHCMLLRTLGFFFFVTSKGTLEKEFINYFRKWKEQWGKLAKVKKNILTGINSNVSVNVIIF